MEKTNIKRRNFLLGLGLGGMGAAVALLTGKPATAPETEADTAEAPPASKGYRLSQHVQTYYRKARI
ncbi:MAG TPA: formate dehydrogenase [Methylophilaceae bacterium]|nr:formate dehydrogenase [Methylophilaceae bacterium]HQR60324.1 formate dehydrogenase [Methylophilaceae bacterium]